jgi:diacylglycerol kinase family enzyme
MTDTNSNESSTLSSDEKKLIFFDLPFSELPHNIQEDLKSKNNFYIILANPKSGSQEGKNVLYLASRYKYDFIKNYNLITFPILINHNNKNSNSNNNKNNNNINISLLKSQYSILVFDILIPKEYLKGKTFIKNYLNYFPHNQLKILIAGGDGSVLSIIEDFHKNEIDINRLIFGIMPMGTGNDLCHSLGYGNNVEIGKKITNLENLLYKYTKSKISKIDIWEIIINFNDNFSMMVCTSNGEKNINFNNTKNNKIFVKHFINYMSIGYDAVCGAEFESKRSNSRSCNRIIYGYEAVKRYLCCKKNHTINELINNFVSYDNNNIVNNNINNNNIDEEKLDSSNNIIRVNSNKHILFEKEENNEKFNEELINKNNNIILNEKIIKTNSNINNNNIIIDSNEKQYENNENFNKNNNNILFKMNKKIIFDNNIEKSSIKGSPIVLIAQNINYYMGGTQNIWNKSNAKDNKFSEQLFDDKKLEFFSYNNGFEMAIERIFTGFANRIYQGNGPIILDFRENRDFYINIDGEFYHLINPKNMMFTHSKIFNNGQINILKYESGF